MLTLIEHIVKLTDHRDRDLLELTLSRALIDLLPIGRIVIARVVREDDDKRWLEVARLDAKGGGRVLDPLRVDFQSLLKLENAPERYTCLRTRERVEMAWAGPDGPRVNYLPLFSDSRSDDEGVIEVHSDAQLGDHSMQLLDHLRHIYRNMYTLLEFSDRDPMTGLLNRKSLNDAFYSAVLEDLDANHELSEPHPAVEHHERRHRVPANYWLGSASIDNYRELAEKHSQLLVNEMLALVARIMKSTFRVYDRVYRFDGGHFGVLMHCPDEALVLAAFERLRTNVEKTNFQQIGRMTVSCGFTRVMADDSPDSALEKTEHAVDFARRSGGNKACSYMGMVRRGYFCLS